MYQPLLTVEAIPPVPDLELSNPLSHNVPFGSECRANLRLWTPCVNLKFPTDGLQRRKGAEPAAKANAPAARALTANPPLGGV